MAATEVRGARFRVAANQDLDLRRHPPVVRAGPLGAVLVALAAQLLAAQVRQARSPAVDNLAAAAQASQARSPAVDNLARAAPQVREARFRMAAKQEDRQRQEAQAALDAAWAQSPTRQARLGC